jgi:serine/threonine-protein kinase HipA
MHVIDGCQALDFPSALKYERNLGKGEHVRNIREGVSFERLFSLLDRVRTPATARLFLLRWALLQVLLGNSDAHGKNISFHVHRSGLMPAPIYDLVCVSVYGPKIETDLAMAYGDAFTIEDITPYALADFATRTNTPREQLAQEIVAMANAMLKFAPVLAESDVYVGDEREHVRRIADVVCVQANRFLKLAPEVPKIDAALL